MANCKFLRQKKQVLVNGEWVDTRSYRYIPYCDGGIPCVIIKGGTPNDNVFIGVNKYDNSSSTEKYISLSLDADGYGYIELESDDCITYINEEIESSSSIAEIRGCYVNKFGRWYYASGYYDMHTMIVNCSTYKRPQSDLIYNGLMAYNLIFRGFDVTKVTDMSFMFDNCRRLTSLDVSSFDTSNVTNMSGMFRECGSLTSLDVSNFDTSNVTNMNSMFRYCGSLTSLDVTNFDTSKVTDIGGMFAACQGLTSLDVTHFNTSNVTDMRTMFGSCYSLTSLDVSNFDTSNVTGMFGMFYDCYKLTSLDVSNFNTSNVTSMVRMFDGCFFIESLDVSNFDTSNVIGMNFMFSACPRLTSLNLSGWDMRNVDYEHSMNMFYGTGNLKTIKMIGCDSETIIKIKDALSYNNMLDRVTIITE